MPLPRPSSSIPKPAEGEVACEVCGYPLPSEKVESVEREPKKKIFHHPGRDWPCAKYANGVTVNAKQVS